MIDDLYERLRAANPVPDSTAVEPADSPRTRALMEAAMATETPSHLPDTATGTSTGTGTGPTATPPARRSRWMPAMIAAAAAGVVVAGSLLVPDLFGDDAAPIAPTAAALELSMPSTDPVMAMCLALSADELRRMPVAFGGTATAVTDSTVTIAVETWFSGGDAATVELTTPPDAPVALLGYGIDFEVGTRYLVSSTAGAVNICGFSGEATPELQAVYDEAYGS